MGFWIKMGRIFFAISKNKVLIIINTFPIFVIFLTIIKTNEHRFTAYLS